MSQSTAPEKAQQAETLFDTGVSAEQEAPVPEAVKPPPNGKNPAAVALGRLGGKKGGLARAKKLTKEQRAEIARKAAQARWAKKQG